MPDGVQTSSTPPDAADILASDWPVRALGKISGSRGPQYQAVIRKSVLDAIHAHGQSTTAVEICGVLVGNVFNDEHGPYLHIQASIPGDRAASHAAQVTFTAETWSAIQKVMDRDYPDDRIVGWYHTHPGFGVFLSGMDLFIQDNFFNLPWQVALVYDPISGDEGVFFWKGGKTERQEYLIEADPIAAPVEAAAAPAPRSSLFAPKEAKVEPAGEAALLPIESPTAAPQPSVPQTANEVPPAAFDPAQHVWAGTQAIGSRRFRIPMWLIGLVAFIVSFGLTLWAMYSMQER